MWSQEQELLPEWTKFARGILDIPDLRPTAARDNVMKDEAYFRLRGSLGRLIVESLVTLSRTEKRKLLRLCEWHHYHLKGMAVHHEDFHTAVIDHLPFENNCGQMTLPELRDRQPTPVGKSEVGSSATPDVCARARRAPVDANARPSRTPSAPLPGARRYGQSRGSTALTLDDLDEAQHAAVGRDTQAAAIFWTEFCDPGQHPQEREAVRLILEGKPTGLPTRGLRRLREYGYVVGSDGAWRLRVPLFEDWIRAYGDL